MKGINGNVALTEHGEHSNFGRQRTAYPVVVEFHRHWNECSAKEVNVSGSDIIEDTHASDSLPRFVSRPISVGSEPDNMV